MILSLLLAPAALAETPMGTERQRAAIGRCMQHWGETPFSETPRFRVLSASVRVMGVGSREVLEAPTDKPELVLVEPSVNVLTKTTYKLHNPNGWYCFNANVGVLSKIVFDVDCGANLADSRSGAVVAADSETNGGVVVLGDVEVRRDCPAKPDPAPSTPTAPEVLPPAEKPE